MEAAMKNKKIVKFPNIKKNIEAFLSEEEGSISKKDIFNLGLTLLVLGVVLDNSTEAIAKTTHSSSFVNTADHGEHNSYYSS